MERAKKFYKSMIGLDKTSLNHKRVLTTFLLGWKVGAYYWIGFVYYFAQTTYKVWISKSQKGIKTMIKYKLTTMSILALLFLSACNDGGSSGYWESCWDNRYIHSQGGEEIR